MRFFGLTATTFSGAGAGLALVFFGGAAGGLVGDLRTEATDFTGFAALGAGDFDFAAGKEAFLGAPLGAFLRIGVAAFAGFDGGELGLRAMGQNRWEK